MLRWWHKNFVVCCFCFVLKRINTFGMDETMSVWTLIKFVMWPSITSLDVELISQALLQNFRKHVISIRTAHVEMLAIKQPRGQYTWSPQAEPCKLQRKFCIAGNFERSVIAYIFWITSQTLCRISVFVLNQHLIKNKFLAFS